jgi:release factor glutamine methyltransferase
MTIGELYRKYLQEMKAFLSSGEADQITNMVFEHVVGLSRSDLIKNPDAALAAFKKEELLHKLSLLVTKTPVQYVLGESNFYQLTFEVNQHVLIPRPETEELVERAIHFCRQNNKATVLDIGTGSGCIPISIKKNTTNCAITTMDISSDAIALAKKNALKHQAEIHFLQEDFLNENFWKHLPCFDLIVSNPPYIPSSEKASMDDNVVLYEPHIALFVPDIDPLIFYKKIMEFGKSHLNPTGKIIVEIHEKKGKEVCQLVKENGYEAILIKDFFGKDRMVEISLSP